VTTNATIFRTAATSLAAAALLCTPLWAQGQDSTAAHDSATKTAQTAPTGRRPNWQNLDLQTDSVFGISTERAYKELLGNTKATPVIVAVIDGGVDVNHEDLRAVIWNNAKEVAGNNVDDDKNGFADDVHGWNFIGSSKGSVQFDNLEMTRLLRKLRPKYSSLSDTTGLSAAERDTLALFHKLTTSYNAEYAKAQQNLMGMTAFQSVLNAMTSKIGKSSPTLQDVQAYQPQTQGEAQVRHILMGQLERNPSFSAFTDELTNAITHFKEEVEYNLNFSFDPRDMVGDDTTNVREHLYGNADVAGPDADHGSHVAGIIGAVRTNNLGIEGVADAVQIMSVRTVPTGDERDKDVANAIRYAVDNGARVINMSFGKAYSPQKSVVDDAVKYAMSKDVLLVAAAGNDNKDVDKDPNYPNRIYADGSGQAAGWIEVGASDMKNDSTLKAPFSNYGKTGVDVFAPGVAIFSTTPGSKYADHDGTSMAAPVVTGLAALIRSRYPKLTAVQVKEIIMKSVVPVTHPVLVRVGDSVQHVPFTDLCVTGGVVNAYNALKLAATYK
jgi:subtilisin family serine protease